MIGEDIVLGSEFRRRNVSVDLERAGICGEGENSTTIWLSLGSFRFLVRRGFVALCDKPFDGRM